MFTRELVGDAHFYATFCFLCVSWASVAYAQRVFGVHTLLFLRNCRSYDCGNDDVFVLSLV